MNNGNTLDALVQSLSAEERTNLLNKINPDRPIPRWKRKGFSNGAGSHAIL
jgi:hypothetical protein